MRIRFSVTRINGSKSVRTMLDELNANTTLDARKRMNKRLAKVFARAGVTVSGPVWFEAKRVLWSKGVGAATKYVQSLAK